MSAAAQTPAWAPRPAADPTAAEILQTIVLGLGNPLLTDDSVGLRVIESLRPALSGLEGVELAEDYRGGLRLMERLIGYDRAIIIDAQRSGAPPGTVSLLPSEGRPTRHVSSTHDLDLWTALELGRRAGARLPSPRDIRIVAVEAAEVELFGEECTPAVAAAISRASELVRSLLAEWR